MKRLIVIVVFLLAFVATANAQQKIQGYCEKGGEAVVTDGRNSTTKVQRSYPSCTITVYLTGTLTLATIYSDYVSTPKANPFTADSDGYYFFIASDGKYDVRYSGAGITTPFTRSGFWIVSSGGGGGGVTSVGLNLPASTFSVSGSPVTSAGTLAGTFINQNANTVFAGPTAGAAATPTWRALVAADLPAGTVTTDVMRVQNVKEGYGCIGDGVTNDTTCLTNAIAAANSSAIKKIVYLPEGSYLINSGLTVPVGVTIRGAGPNSIVTTASTIDVFTASGNYVTFENFKINGGRRGIVYAVGTTNGIVQKMTFTGITAHTGAISTAAVYHAGQAADFWIVDSISTGNGSLSATDDGADFMIAASTTPFNNRIHIARNTISGGFSRFSVACFDCSDSEFVQNYVDQNNQIAASTPSDISGYGFVVYASSNTGVIKRNRITDNTVVNAAGSGIYTVNSFETVIANNTLRDTAKQQLDSSLPVGAISLNAGDNSTVADNVIETTTTGNGIAVTGNYSTTTLNGGIDNVVTSMTLTTTIYFGAIGDKATFQIDNERILCTIGSATAVSSCVRGMYGTTAASHSNGATVTAAGPANIAITGNTIRQVAGNAGINFRNTCNGCVVDANTISNGTTGILITAGITLRDAKITNNTIDQITGQGMNLPSVNDTTISGNRIIQPSAHGILLTAGERNIVTGNNISQAGASALDNSATNTIVYNNEIYGNVTGITDAGVTNIYRGNKVYGNTTDSSFGATPTSQQITITSGTTPDVSGASEFILNYGAPTTITNFTGGSILNPIIVVRAANGNVTIQGAGAFTLHGNNDFAMSTGDVLVLMYSAGWYEIGRQTSTNPIGASRFYSGTTTYGTTFEAVKTGAIQALLRSTTSTSFSNFTMYDDAGTKTAALQLLNSAYPSVVMSGATTGTSLNLYTSGALDLNIGTNDVMREKWSSSGAWFVVLGSDAVGDLFFKTSATQVARLGIGTAGQCLVVSAGLPAWGSCSAGSGITGTIANTQIAFGTGVDQIGGDAGLTFTTGTDTVALSGHMTIAQTSTTTVPFTVTAVGSSSVEQARFQNSSGQDKFGVTADANPYWRGQTSGVTLAGASDAKVYFDKNAGAIDGELVASKGGGSFRPIVVASESSFTGNVIPLWDNSNSWEIKNSILTQTSTTTVTAAGKLIATATATLSGINVGTTTADPSAPVEGDIYYNSSTDKFRCYENSAWTNCIGSGSSLPVVDTTSIVEGSVDNTKEMRFEVDGLTTATTRVLTVPDADIVIAGSASALTLGRVPYVTTGGLLLDTTNFQWNNGATTLTVGASGGSTGFIDLQGASNSGAIRMQGATHPGTGGGVILPFVGGSQSSGPGLWWGGGAYGSLAGFWISGGFNLQGWNSSNSSLKIRKGTGTSSDGTVILTFNPDSGYIELVPYGTSGGNTSEVRYMELAAGGSNYFATKAADAITTTYTMTWPTDTPAAGEVLTVTALAGSTISTEWAAGGGGSSPPFADTTDLVKGSADATKLLRIEVDGFTTATTRTLTPQDASYTIAGTTVALGGTGATTFTTDGVLYGAGTGAIQATAQGAANSILTANAGAPAFSQTPIVNTSLQIGVASSQTGQLKLAVSGDADLTTIQAGDTPASAVTYKWPADNPAANEFLKVTSFGGGTAVLEWAAGGGGGSPAGVDGDYQINISGAFAAGVINQSTTGRPTVTPTAVSSGVDKYWRIITPADTGLTADTEAIGMQFGGNTSAATVTRTLADGTTIATQRESLFVAPTYAAAGATTITTAATLAITGGPIAGANTTIQLRVPILVTDLGAGDYVLLGGDGAGSVGQTRVKLQRGILDFFESSAGMFNSFGNGVIGLFKESLLNGTSFTLTNNTAVFAMRSVDTSGSGTTSISDVFTINGNIAGVPAAGFGTGVKLLNKSTTADRDAVRIAAVWSTATDASRTSYLRFDTVENAGSLVEHFRIAGTPTANGAAATMTGVNGSSDIRGQVSENITLSTSGTTTDSTIDLPANSIILSVTARITTTITTATDWKLGDPTVADRFSDANSTMTSGTTQVGINQWKADRTTAGQGAFQQTSAKVRVTTTGTPGAGAIRITIHYLQLTPPTS